MGIKSYILKKLYFHIRKALNSYSLESSIKTSNTIPKTAIITNSLIAGNIKIGECVKIEDAQIFGSDVEIGDYTTFDKAGCTIHSELNSVKIGKYCSIARKVDIQEINHNKNKITTSMISSSIFHEDIRKDMVSSGAINIGNDVWIGAQSVILSGVNIGNGAIIGANSVVSRDIPPYAIAVGSPAKVISYRFEDEIIVKLEEIKWWNWSIEKIKKNAYIFLKDNLELKDFDKIS